MVLLQRGGVSQGVGVPKETHITCDFPGGGGGPDPLTPSGSARGVA